MSQTTVVSESGKWSTFFVAGEMYALRVEDVQEVLMVQPLAKVPLAPEHVVGLLNLRGQVITAIDLRQRLGAARREQSGDEKLLVVKTEDGPVSILVDEIGDVLELGADRWVAPPDTAPANRRKLMVGICPIDGHVVLGLDIKNVLDSADEESARAGLNS